MKNLKKGQTRIFFDDQGQDFLSWTLDKTGRVIDCHPFQSSVWCDRFVIDHAKLKIGDKANIIGRGDSQPITIKYKIVRIDRENGNSFFGEVLIRKSKATTI